MFIIKMTFVRLVKPRTINSKSKKSFVCNESFQLFSSLFIRLFKLCSFVLDFFHVDVFDFSLVEGLATEWELVFLLGDSVVADNSEGGLFFEVEFLGSFSSAHSVLHYFLFFVHCADEFRLFGFAFGVDLLVELTGIEILFELFFFSFMVSEDGVSGTGFFFVGGGEVSDGRHVVFYDVLVG